LSAVFSVELTAGEPICRRNCQVQNAKRKSVPVSLGFYCARPQFPSRYPLLTLDQWVDSAATRFRLLGTLAGAMIADVVADLASAIRATNARDPETAMDRLAAMAAANGENN
jgi:hypothetical protein